MKQYKLNISIRHGLETHQLSEVILNTTEWEEGDRLSKLSVFKPDAYLVYSLEEMPEAEEVEN